MFILLMGNSDSRIAEDVRSQLATFPEFLIRNTLAQSKIFTVIYCNHDSLGPVVIKNFFQYQHMIEEKTRDQQKDTLLKELHQHQFMLGVMQRVYQIHTHPNVVPYQHCELTNRAAFLLRPYFLTTLTERPFNRPFLFESQLRWSLLQCVHAVAQLHSGGFAHLDLKSDNFCLTSFGTVHLVDASPFKPYYLPAHDLGIWGSLFESSTRTHPGCYIAPERFYFDSSAPQSSATTAMKLSSDSFAVACVFLEVLKGAGRVVLDRPMLLRLARALNPNSGMNSEEVEKTLSELQNDLWSGFNFKCKGYFNGQQPNSPTKKSISFPAAFPANNDESLNVENFSLSPLSPSPIKLTSASSFIPESKLNTSITGKISSVEAVASYLINDIILARDFKERPSMSQIASRLNELHFFDTPFMNTLHSLSTLLMHPCLQNPDIRVLLLRRNFVALLSSLIESTAAADPRSAACAWLNPLRIISFVRSHLRPISGRTIQQVFSGTALEHPIPSSGIEYPLLFNSASEESLGGFQPLTSPWEFAARDMIHTEANQSDNDNKNQLKNSNNQTNSSLFYVSAADFNDNPILSGIIPVLHGKKCEAFTTKILSSWRDCIQIQKNGGDAPLLTHKDVEQLGIPISDVGFTPTQCAARSVLTETLEDALFYLSSPLEESHYGMADSLFQMSLEEQNDCMKNYFSTLKKEDNNEINSSSSSTFPLMDDSSIIVELLISILPFVSLPSLKICILEMLKCLSVASSVASIADQMISPVALCLADSNASVRSFALEVLVFLGEQANCRFETNLRALQELQSMRSSNPTANSSVKILDSDGWIVGSRFELPTSVKSEISSMLALQREFDDFILLSVSPLSQDPDPIVKATLAANLGKFAANSLMLQRLVDEFQALQKVDSATAVVNSVPATNAPPVTSSQPDATANLLHDTSSVNNHVLQFEIDSSSSSMVLPALTVLPSPESNVPVGSASNPASPSLGPTSAPAHAANRQVTITAPIQSTSDTSAAAVVVNSAGQVKNEKWNETRFHHIATRSCFTKLVKEIFVDTLQSLSSKSVLNASSQITNSNNITGTASNSQQQTGKLTATPPSKHYNVLASPPIASGTSSMLTLTNVHELNVVILALSNSFMLPKKTNVDEEVLKSYCPLFDILQLEHQASLHHYNQIWSNNNKNNLQAQQLQQVNTKKQTASNVLNNAAQKSHTPPKPPLELILPLLLSTVNAVPLSTTSSALCEPLFKNLTRTCLHAIACLIVKAASGPPDIQPQAHARVRHQWLIDEIQNKLLPMLIQSGFHHASCIPACISCLSSVIVSLRRISKFHNLPNIENHPTRAWTSPKRFAIELSKQVVTILSLILRHPDSSNRHATIECLELIGQVTPAAEVVVNLIPILIPHLQFRPINLSKSAIFPRPSFVFEGGGYGFCPKLLPQPDATVVNSCIPDTSTSAEVDASAAAALTALTCEDPFMLVSSLASLPKHSYSLLSSTLIKKCNEYSESQSGTTPLKLNPSTSALQQQFSNAANLPPTILPHLPHSILSPSFQDASTDAPLTPTAANSSARLPPPLPSTPPRSSPSSVVGIAPPQQQSQQRVRRMAQNPSNVMNSSNNPATPSNSARNNNFAAVNNATNSPQLTAAQIAASYGIVWSASTSIDLLNLASGVNVGGSGSSANVFTCRDPHAIAIPSTGLERSSYTLRGLTELRTFDDFMPLPTSPSLFRGDASLQQSANSGVIIAPASLAQPVISLLLDPVVEYFRHLHSSFPTIPSGGPSPFPSASLPDTILAHADATLPRADQQGRNSVVPMGARGVQVAKNRDRTHNAAGQQRSMPNSATLSVKNNLRLVTRVPLALDLQLPSKHSQVRLHPRTGHANVYSSPLTSRSSWVENSFSVPNRLAERGTLVKLDDILMIPAVQSVRDWPSLVQLVDKDVVVPSGLPHSGSSLAFASSHHPYNHFPILNIKNNNNDNSIKNQDSSSIIPGVIHPVVSSMHTRDSQGTTGGVHIYNSPPGALTKFLIPISHTSQWDFLKLYYHVSSFNAAAESVHLNLVPFTPPLVGHAASPYFSQFLVASPIADWHALGFLIQTIYDFSSHPLVSPLNLKSSNPTLPYAAGNKSAVIGALNSSQSLTDSDSTSVSNINNKSGKLGSLSDNNNSTSISGHQNQYLQGDPDSISTGPVLLGAEAAGVCAPPVTHLDVTHDGRLLIAANARGCVRIWSVSSLEVDVDPPPPSSFLLPGDRGATALTALRTSPSLAVGSDDGSVMIVARLENKIPDIETAIKSSASRRLLLDTRSDAFSAFEFANDIRGFGSNLDFSNCLNNSLLSIIGIQHLECDFDSSLVATRLDGVVFGFDTRSRRLSFDISLPNWCGLPTCQVIGPPGSQWIGVATSEGCVFVYDKRFPVPIAAWQLRTAIGSDHSNLVSTPVSILTGREASLYPCSMFLSVVIPSPSMFDGSSGTSASTSDSVTCLIMFDALAGRLQLCLASSCSHSSSESGSSFNQPTQQSPDVNWINPATRAAISSIMVVPLHDLVDIHSMRHSSVINAGSFLISSASKSNSQPNFSSSSFTVSEEIMRAAHSASPFHAQSLQTASTGLGGASKRLALANACRSMWLPRGGVPTFLLSGHQDGSVAFWDLTALASASGQCVAPVSSSGASVTSIPGLEHASGINNSVCHDYLMAADSCQVTSGILDGFKPRDSSNPMLCSSYKRDAVWNTKVVEMMRLHNTSSGVEASGAASSGSPSLRVQSMTPPACGHRDAILSMAVVPGGVTNLLVTGGRDGIVKVWK